MKEALGKRQHGVWVQPLGFQGLCLPFFLLVFTEQECVLSHLHPRLKSAGRGFQETLDNIHPVLGGHRRGVPLGSGIFGLASVGAKALHSWWGAYRSSIALQVFSEYCL